MPQIPTTPSFATGRGTVAGTRLAALLVTPLASLKIAVVHKFSTYCQCAVFAREQTTARKQQVTTWQLEVALLFILLCLSQYAVVHKSTS